jgi:hypothetical protein
MKSKNVRTILGVMIGMFLSCVFFFFYSNSLINKNYSLHSKRSCCTHNCKMDTILPPNTLLDFKDKNNATNERISVLNTRFNDLYVLGGVIVTLLLAIVIGIYVKTENEVEVHIQQNFGKYEEQIKRNVADSEKQLAKLIFFVKMAESSMSSIKTTAENTTTPEEAVSTSGDSGGAQGDVQASPPDDAGANEKDGNAPPPDDTGENKNDKV